ncbi:MAG: diguanylate cyclase domain-containing protein [Thermodesulfobacteriota bacterium]
MDDHRKTKAQLLEEIRALRERLAALEEGGPTTGPCQDEGHDGEGRYRRLLESVTDYIYTVRKNSDGSLTTVHGPECQRVTGYAPSEYEADPLLWIRMVPGEDREAVLLQARTLLGGTDAPSLEHRIVHKDGSVRWVRNTPVLRRDVLGGVTGYDGIITDITARKEAEEQIRRLSMHDALTGLPNREHYAVRMKQAMYRADRNMAKVAVLFVDLDDFKSVNDLYGHAAGDELLIAVGERLLRCVRKSDLVARLGGDEFVVMLADLADASDAAGVAAKIVRSLSRPFRMSGKSCRIGASVGISMYPDDCSAPCPDQATLDLLAMADAAMYEVKRAGRGGYRFHGHGTC